MQANYADLTVCATIHFLFDESRPTLGRNMIGVILWSDTADQKAVIWCEDQGDLAFLSASDSVILPDPFFEVGDVVEFDVRTQRNLRLASNPNRLERYWGKTVTDGLRSISALHKDTASATAKVIPFRADHLPGSSGGTIPRRKRLG